MRLEKLNFALLFFLRSTCSEGDHFKSFAVEKA
jgi:hypothetical protein